MNKEKTNSVENKILHLLDTFPSGSTFIYDDFAECGPYTCIRSAVVRLCRNNLLHRVCQGVYLKPNPDGSAIKLCNIHIAKEIDRRSDMTEPYGTTLDYVNGILKEMPEILLFNTHGSSRRITLPDGTIVKYRKIQE